MNIQRILVAVDYSDCSRAALRFAVELANRFQAELDVVHVWDRPSYISDVVMTRAELLHGHSLTQMIEVNAELDLQRFLTSCELPLDQAVQGRLVSGDPASALLRELKQGQHDMVVVGTHGRSGLSRVLLGSVAEKLLRLATVPVVTVPDAAAKEHRA